MRHINFDLDLEFDTPEHQWLSEHVLLMGQTLLAARNYHYLKEHPDTPKCYDDPNCIYLVPEQLERRPTDSQLAALRVFLRDTMKQTEDEIQHHVDLAKGVEIFRDIPRMREHGGGDCDNYGARRAAELAVAGADVRPRMTVRQQGGRTIYHALVIWPDGSSEDPSLIMGMGGVSRAADRLYECRKNYERYENYWNDAKEMLASESFSSDAARVARAAQLKEKIDSLGLLPKDGVFRVGQQKSVAIQAPKKHWWSL